MSAHPLRSMEDGADGLLRRIGELRASLQSRDPERLAEATGSIFDPLNSEFRLAMWGRTISLSFPEGIAYDRDASREVSLADQALLLYYFNQADGTPLAEQWISFSELPDGKFYNAAFQGYSGKELARLFGENRASFAAAASDTEGQSWSDMAPDLGDCSWKFDILPRISLLVVFWQGDEDFPSTYQILFDASVNHYLPTDVCAILGGMLARKLKAARHSSAGG